MKAKIGIGIITYNRKDYFERCVESILKHLDFVDEIVVVDDGSDEDYVNQYAGRVHTIRKPNGGVASAKNAALAYLIEHDCTYIFLAEDDVEVLDRMAVVGYLAVNRMTGIPHLNWAHHGDNKKTGPLFYSDQPIIWWPNCVGAWSFYTKEAIDNVGYFDENFKNAYEHVEHSWRIYKGHFDYGVWPDALDSSLWLREQPGALENSSIRDVDGNWQKRIKEALAYWRSKDPECPAKDPNWDAPHEKGQK